LTEELAWEQSRLAEREERRRNRRVYYLASDMFKRAKHAIRGKGRREVSLMKRLCPSGGSVLDIGCSDGATLKELTDGRWIIFGIEPSPGLARRADELCRRYGGRVEATTAVIGLPRFPAESFDMVMMRSYLEHEAYAGVVLREVRCVLKAGGRAVIKVPNADCWNARLRGCGWPGVRHPDHVNYFTARHLGRLPRDCGFGVFRFEPLSLLPTSDNLWVVATREES
jgi:SAM-dependent methyltransferase